MAAKKKRKLYIMRCCRIFICVSIIALVFYLYLPPKENKIETMNATVGKNHVDVLCVGSSHMFNGLNTVQMYEENGSAAYCLSCGSQAPWQSYYYMLEACKCQKPRMIIFDVYMMGSRDVDGYTDSQTVQNMLDCPLSINKIKTLMVSEADSKLDVILRFPYIYNDYESFTGLTTKKLYGTVKYSMGYDKRTKTEEYTDEVIDANEVTQISEIDSKYELYLRRIIDLCRKKGIELLLINAPWPMIDYEKQARFNYIWKVADENNVRYIDGCKLSQEIGMDWKTDSRGDGGHLNHSGITKFTKYVDDFIREHYDLLDRRGDAEYACYERGIEWLNQKMKK